MQPKIRCPARRAKSSASINASSRVKQQQQQTQSNYYQPRRRVARRQKNASTIAAAAAATKSIDKKVATGSKGSSSSDDDEDDGSPDESDDGDTSSGSSSDGEDTRSTGADSDDGVVKPTLSHGRAAPLNGNISQSNQSSSSQQGSKRRSKARAGRSSDAMQPVKLDWKLGLLYTLLVLQVLVVMVYVSSTPHMADFSGPALRDTVSFVDLEASQTTPNKSGPESSPARLITGETSLRDSRTFKLFQAYNGTLCWRSGVDDRRTQRELGNEISGSPPRCSCLQGWHGSDCGQPEVVWRAIMASKQNIKLRRRKLARRIVHTLVVKDYNAAIVEVIVEELYHVVDLFVVCDFSTAEDNFRHKLAKGFLSQQQDKILYLSVASRSSKPARVVAKYAWERVRKQVRNIRDDDIYVTSDAEQILNARALMFLKAYDGWPQPIGFRLRWSVFGFFWQHPSRTRITVGACTVALMREAHRLNSLVLGDKELSNSELVVAGRENLGLVIGDLNHYGGWYCQFCQGPANIIQALREMNRTKEMTIEKSVDVPFVEDLIGSGTWFDEKTSLLRAHKSRESYYAPETVITNNWKYDWLLENFYAKLDYY